jgi:hypothetical protein
VQPPAAKRDTVSDRRKRRSYDVEARFYREVAARCDDSCRVARLYGADVEPGHWLLVLEDLDAAGFVDRREEASGNALDACLAWLAAFHARFLGETFDGLWPIGTYWHLDTRRDELAAIRDRSLRERADELDARLARARFQTLLHGHGAGAEQGGGPLAFLAPELLEREVLPRRVELQPFHGRLVQGGVAGHGDLLTHPLAGDQDRQADEHQGRSEQTGQRMPQPAAVVSCHVGDPIRSASLVLSTAAGHN